MKVTYEVTKKNRKVNTIIFKVVDYGPRHYDFAGKDENRLQASIKAPGGYEPDAIQIRLLSCGIRITPNTLSLKQQEYGEKLFINAIKILEDRVQDNHQEKLKAPVRYLTGILDNLKNKLNPTVAPEVTQQSDKKNGFANFTQRKYDYNKLEKNLLGWTDVDDDYEE